MTPIILIDCMNLAFRCHWAFHNLSVDGKPTGVLYGALRTIRDLQDKVSRKLILVWDHGVPVVGAARPRNWRDDMMTTYKANRKHDDGEWNLVVQQLPILHQLLQWLGYSSVSVLGLEADDVISLLASNTKEPCLIFSTDRDFYQLITEDDRVRILVPKRDKSDFKIINAGHVFGLYGIHTNRWAEYLALGGDSCDNIKPMKGMGPKTAIKLLQSGVCLNPSTAKWTASEIDTFNVEGLIPKLPSKYDGATIDILKSYEVARLPTNWNDPRIKDCIDSYRLNMNSQFQSPALPSTAFDASQRWNDQAHRKQCEVKFTNFLADHEMSSMLAVRRQFFQTDNQGEQPCRNLHRNPNPAPKLRRPVRQSLV